MFLFGSAGVCRDVAPSLLSGDVPEAAVSSGEGKAVAWISSSPFFLHRMADQLSTSTLQPCFMRGDGGRSTSVLFTTLRSAVGHFANLWVIRF